MAKRVLTSKAKPGELKAQWGKEDRWSGADVTFAWGEGVSRCDASLLHTIMGTTRFYPAGMDKPLGTYRTEHSFIDELEARGYDITTFRFSVQKKQPT